MRIPKQLARFETIGALAIVTLVGFLGYTAFMQYRGDVAANAPQPSAQKVTAPASTPAKPIATAPSIEQSADLDSASAALDAIDVDGTDDDSQLDVLMNELN